jgi:hypothetical protein
MIQQALAVTEVDAELLDLRFPGLPPMAGGVMRYSAPY